MSTDHESGGIASFGPRLDNLMRTVPGPDGTSWSNVKLSGALARLGLTVSAGYISQLRTGVKTNPAAQIVQTVAKAFAIPVTYFFDDDVSAVDQQLRQLAALRRDDADILIGLTRDMGPKDVNFVRALVENYRTLRGLDNPPAVNHE